MSDVCGAGDKNYTSLKTRNITQCTVRVKPGQQFRCVPTILCGSSLNITKEPLGAIISLRRTVEGGYVVLLAFH